MANDDFIGARGGVVTDQQVRDLAAAAGMQGAERLAAARIQGQAFNAVEIMTLRKALLQSAGELNAAQRQAALPTASDQDVLWYAMVRERHYLLQGTVAQATAEWGRAGRALQDIREAAKQVGAEDAVQQATGRTLFQLREEAKLAAKLDTPEKASQFNRVAHTPKFSRMILEYWINNLISGPATHTTYAIGNMLLALNKVGPETLVAAAIGAARGREGERVHVGEVGAQLRGAAQGFIPAVHASTEALRTGMTALLPGESGRRLQFLNPGASGDAVAPIANEAARLSDVRESLFGLTRGLRDAFIATEPLLEAAGKNVSGLPLIGTEYSPLGAIPDIRVGNTVLPVGTMQRLPSRMVAAIHSFFRVMNYSMEKSALAYRAAATEGLEGEAFAARVGELWQNPTAEMMEAARSEATELTLMGQGGKFTQRLSALLNTEFNLPGLGPVPLLKFIDPFVHISSNVMKQSLLMRTPLGMLSPELRADLFGRNGPIAQDKAQARMLVGSAFAMTIGGLAAQGLASGSGPTDPREAAMWRLAGNQAHSIRIGDFWYDTHRLGPLGMLMGLGADLYEVGHLADQAEFTKAAAHLQFAITHNILDESFMRGPSDLIKAIEDPGRYGEAYVRNFLSSFVPFSVGMAQEARAFDPYSREARTVVDAMRAKIPFASMDLLPRVDIWGQPMPNRDALIAPGITSIYAQRISTDPVNLAMVELGLHPAPVERKIRNVELTDEQHLRFAQYAGRMSKARLDVIVRSPDWQQWDPQTRRDVVQAVIRQSREVARGQIMASDPTIIERATAAKLDKLRK